MPGTINDLQDVVLAIVREHQAWAPPIVFALAFGESLAFISLLLPATAILFGVGGLIGAAGIAFWPIWIAALLGAALGDWVSYWLGYRYKDAIAQVWPLSRRPNLNTEGHVALQAMGGDWDFCGPLLRPPALGGSARRGNLRDVADKVSNR